jgi:hypothetical protein
MGLEIGGMLRRGWATGEEVASNGGGGQDDGREEEDGYGGREEEDDGEYNRCATCAAIHPDVCTAIMGVRAQ